MIISHGHELSDTQRPWLSGMVMNSQLLKRHYFHSTDSVIIAWLLKALASTQFWSYFGLFSFFSSSFCLCSCGSFCWVPFLLHSFPNSSASGFIFAHQLPLAQQCWNPVTWKHQSALAASSWPRSSPYIQELSTKFKNNPILLIFNTQMYVRPCKSMGLWGVLNMLGKELLFFSQVFSKVYYVILLHDSETRDPNWSPNHCLSWRLGGQGSNWAAFSYATSRGTWELGLTTFVPLPQPIPHEDSWFIHTWWGALAMRFRRVQLGGSQWIYNHCHRAKISLLLGVKYTQSPNCTPNHDAHCRAQISQESIWWGMESGDIQCQPPERERRNRSCARPRRSAGLVWLKWLKTHGADREAPSVRNWNTVKPWNPIVNDNFFKGDQVQRPSSRTLTKSKSGGLRVPHGCVSKWGTKTM